MLSGNFPSCSAGAFMPSLEANLARYQELIPHLHKTQVALWGRVDEGMMRAACGVMAHYTKCDFIPKDDDSIAMMLNYCCFNVFHPDGRSLMELYAGEHPGETDDERAVLQAHRQSYFSVFEVVQIEPGVGARLRDFFWDEHILVVYPRLAETLRAGLVLPIRVMPLEGFHAMFNGPVPFNNVASVKEYEEHLFNTYGKHGVQKGQPLTFEQRANIETFQSISVLMLRYPELIPAHLRKPSTASPPPAPRYGPLSAFKSVGRNEPCPCGSGKKFKQCCLGRN